MDFEEKDSRLIYNKKHIQLIKTKLVEGKNYYLKKHGREKITNYEICQLINKNTQTYCTIPTITKLLTPAVNVENEVSSINITLVIELCKLFDIDIGYVLSLPEDSTHLPTPTPFGEKITQLDDPGYLGLFHCYRLTATSASDDISYSKIRDTLQTNDNISHSTLEIYIHDNQVRARMVTHNITTLVNGKKQTRNAVLTGTPIFYTKTNNILINLVSNDGECYTMFFDYQPFDSGPMYYREAIFLLSTKGTRYLPLLSKAIITRNEISEKYNDYVRGLLSLNTNTIILSKEKVEDLKSTDYEIAKFFDDFKLYEQIWKRDFYVIPENIAQNINHNTELNKIELQKILLKLRNNSYSLSQVIVGDAYKASVIGKEIQKYEYEVNENISSNLE